MNTDADAPRLLFPLSAALLLAAGLFGGSSLGAPGDTLAQLLALAVLGLLAWNAKTVFAPGSPARRFGAWAALPALLPLLHWLPLPASWVAALPGRAALAAELAAAGAAPMAHVGLNPLAAERALWWLLPALALFLATLALTPLARRRLLLLLFALAAGNVLLGLLQLAGGEASPLRFYWPTNTTQAVGLFANRNHLAGLLALALPLAIAAVGNALVARRADRQGPPLALVAALVLVVALVIGIASAQSRAGLLLGGLGAIAGIALLLDLRRAGQRGVLRALAAVAALSLVLALQFGLGGGLDRFASDPRSDGRWTYTPITIEAARPYAPIGAGLGTFRSAYQTVEMRDRTTTRYIINHAHDDYAELWLEGGVPALAIVLALFGLLAWATRRAWRAPRDADGRLACAAAIALWLAAAHTAMDFPLRTTAYASVVAMLFALVLAQAARPAAAGQLAKPPRPRVN